jgi:LacI family transcriptional regulator
MAGSSRTSVEPPRVTITQVAALAGVSATTVSHVLSGKRLVAASTRETVHEAIRTLGYRPNHTARSLRTRRSQMIAVVVPDITNPFFGVLTRGLADVVYEAGYGTYVCNTDGAADREAAFLEDIVDRGADGLVMAAVDGASRGARTPADLGVPVVCIGEALDHPRIDVVAPEDGIGTYAVVGRLLQRPVRRVAMVEGPLAASRTEAFVRAVIDAGLTVDPELLVAGDWTRPGGRTAMERLLAMPDRPDAVFCANDLMAIGAIEAIHEAGLDVPGDVAVAGFDDVDAASMVNPPLTTAVNPSYETGVAAGRLLLSRLTHEYDGVGRRVEVPCPLVVRESA